MITVLLILFYIFTPVLILYFCKRYSVIRKVGSILIAYIIGLIIGNIGVLPENSFKVQDMINTITIPLALPLLLFSLNIKIWFKMAGKTALSLFLALISMLIVVVLGFFIFKDSIDENWKVAGMLTAVYSGGTPNLASIKTALDVDPNIYILTHSYDIVLSAIFLLFVISIGQKTLGLILPAYKKEENTNTKNNSIEEENFFDIFTKDKFIPVLKAFGISVLIFAVGGGLSMIVPENISMTVAILSITTLGILVSLIPSINKIKRTFDLGMYFILIFSLVVASMADIQNFSTESLDLFFFVAFAVVGSFVLHILLSAIFKIDRDSVIITSTALACSPPFVPMVAGALKNREVIISGITVGIIGYAIGNYLGVTLAYIFKAF
ncbi:MAG: DUF819 family protein [Bacteroidota bacterium]|nr:DUF819 family protein [Bacteroidota bacterium]